MKPRQLPFPVPAVSGQLSLGDGCLLAWAEYGDPTGLPLLYCHGTPGSRLEAGLAHPTAAACGLRLIAFDRPGYGLSTAVPGRTLQQVAADLARLCDHLGLQRLLLLGVSGGGPFACAAASVLGTRVAALGLVCPVGPLAPDPPGRLPLFPWRLLGAWKGRWPPPGLVLAPLRQLERLAPRTLLALGARGLCAKDRATLQQTAVSAQLLESMAEGLAPGYQGLADDLRTFACPWQLDLESIRAPTLLWHGRRDRVVPASLSVPLARALPHCQARFLAGEGHFSLPLDHCARILQALRTAALDAGGPMV